MTRNVHTTPPAPIAIQGTEEIDVCLDTFNSLFKEAGRHFAIPSFLSIDHKGPVCNVTLVLYRDMIHLLGSVFGPIDYEGTSLDELGERWVRRLAELDVREAG